MKELMQKVLTDKSARTKSALRKQATATVGADAGWAG